MFDEKVGNKRFHHDHLYDMLFHFDQQLVLSQENERVERFEIDDDKVAVEYLNKYDMYHMEKLENKSIFVDEWCFSIKLIVEIYERTSKINIKTKEL
jgi:hypothetical protein